MRFHIHIWERHEESTLVLPARRCKRCSKIEHYIDLRHQWEHAPELESDEMDSANA